MFFSKPLREIKERDLQELCDAAYPETDQVEYKEFLPGKRGPDGWHSGADTFGDYARDQLFAEVIAFANTRGGHLILGIEESADNQKRAVALRPIRDCHELAERLSRAAYSCIEPALNDLQIVGVPVGQPRWPSSESSRALSAAFDSSLIKSCVGARRLRAGLGSSVMHPKSAFRARVDTRRDGVTAIDFGDAS
jgi:hypothetical protein